MGLWGDAGVMSIVQKSSTDGSTMKAITKDNVDVAEIVGVDFAQSVVYFIVLKDNGVRRQLHWFAVLSLGLRFFLVCFQCLGVCHFPGGSISIVPFS